MTLSTLVEGRLSVPVFAAPLFIISNPALVIAQCKAGVVGSFPALNARPVSQLDEWLAEITETLAAHDAANAVLNRLSDSFHKSPYVTATLGLYHFRKGDAERGERLYREAIHMISDKSLKSKFLQKLHLELGLYYLQSEKSRAAAKHLSHARDAKDGFEVLTRQAQFALQRLSK